MLGPVSFPVLPIEQSRSYWHNKIMQKRSSNMPRDTNQRAKAVVDLATGVEPAPERKPVKNPAAVELGRLGGLKGGKVRAAKLSKKRRSEIAKKAAQTRWAAKS
jgi:hypothetical protein